MFSKHQLEERPLAFLNHCLPWSSMGDGWILKLEQGQFCALTMIVTTASLCIGHKRAPIHLRSLVFKLFSCVCTGVCMPRCMCMHDECVHMPVGVRKGEKDGRRWHGSFCATLGCAADNRSTPHQFYCRPLTLAFFTLHFPNEFGCPSRNSVQCTKGNGFSD